MAGAGGYLSQVVRDARPRAAPSLYAGRTAAPTAASEAPGYARLMDSQPVPPVSEHASRPETASIPEPAPTVEEEDVTRAPTRITTQPVPTPHAAPSQRARAAGTHPEASQNPMPQSVQTAGETETPHPEPSAPITPRVHVSGTQPRPASFDVVNETAETPSDPASAPVTRTIQSPEVATEPVADRSVPRATDPLTETRANFETPPPVAQQPRVRDVTPPRVRDLGPTVSAQHSQTASNNAPSGSDKTEVHIGKVEVIVQDPPAPRAPAAPRAAPKSPSPARYHVRRF